MPYIMRLWFSWEILKSEIPKPSANVHESQRRDI